MKPATAKGAHAHTFVYSIRIKISRDWAIATIFKGRGRAVPAKDRVVQTTRDGVHYRHRPRPNRVSISKTDIGRDDLRFGGRPEVMWHSHMGATT